MNCGAYYTYKLPSVPFCNMRYCAAFTTTSVTTTTATFETTTATTSVTNATIHYGNNVRIKISGPSG